MKSFPNVAQLNRYKTIVQQTNQKITDCHFFVISLVENFPNKEAIRNIGWNVKSYRELAEKMKKHLCKVKGWYCRRLVKDYVLFIEALSLLVSEWEKIDLYQHNDLTDDIVKIASSVFMNDFYRKVKAAYLSTQIYDKIARKHSIHPTTEITDSQLVSGKHKTFAVNWEYTTGGELINVKVRAKGNAQHFLIIQIQQSQYRYGTCWPIQNYMSPAQVIAQNPMGLNDIQSMMNNQTHQGRNTYCIFNAPANGTHHMVYQYVNRPASNEEIINKLMDDIGRMDSQGLI